LTDYYNAAAARYQPAAYPGEVDLFVGKDIKGFMFAFWRHLVRGRVRVHRVAGTHHTLLADGHLEQFAVAFKRVLAEADRPADHPPHRG
jgi:thioesterase domain-containing protein